MAAGSGLSAGARVGLGAVAAAVAVAAVVYVAGAPAPQVPTTPAPETAVVAVEPAVATTQDPAAAETTGAPEAIAGAVLPRFDVVRIEPDGSATVAGSAAPGATVSLRVDGAEVASAVADGQGKFAALFTMAASEAPRLMSVASVAADGAELAGEQTVAVAPTTAAVPAVAAPAAAVETAASTTVAAEPVAPETAAPAAILLSPEGVEVVQPAAEMPAEVAANVGIDSISYAPDGAVQLGGHGQAAALLRLYLDGAALTEVTVGADGRWVTQLSDVAPGVYTLRVDQVGGDGKVTSRFETPFKRETLEALAAVAVPATQPEPSAAPATTVALSQSVAAEPAATEAVVATGEAPAASENAGAEAATTAAEPAVSSAVAEPAVVPQASVATEAAAPQAVATSEAVVAPEPSSDKVPGQAVVEAEPASQPTRAPVSVTVQPGFTLWGIAESRYGDGVLYVQVFDANKDKIKDPDLIYPGQVLAIPGSD